MFKYFENVFNYLSNSRDEIEDVQKYIAIYRRENTLTGFWGQAFVKKKDDALQTCRDKASGDRVTNVFVCEWRKPNATVECILGHPDDGERVATSIVKALRADNSISEFLEASIIKDRDVKKPRIKVKAVVEKQTPKYVPPYEVKYADIATVEVAAEEKTP
jgi:hypothetical protein